MGSKKKRIGKAARYARKSEGAAKQEEDYSKCPHSFVFHRGQVGRSVIDLVSDMRRVMEPFTASGLKVRQRNTMKDLVSVAGPLNVTHFLSFTHPPTQPDSTDKASPVASLRVIRLPRGPTLTFRVDMYTLSRDVVSAQRRPNTEQRQYRHHPLLIMNGFGGVEGGGGGDSHLKMIASMFQNMFPSINVNKVKLNDIRRCILLNYNADSKTIDFRHYNVRAAPVGMSRGVKKLVHSKVPDLGAYKDISDFLMKDGNLSESEGEMDGPHNEVILPQELSSRGNIKSAKSALRLTEVGPRMTLQLVKIESGMCAGDVLYHEFVTKTAAELADIKAIRLKKQKLKAERTRKQKENIQNKAKKKEEHHEKTMKGMKAKQEADAAMETVAVDNDDEKTDQQYYTEEVGEAPEMGLFSTSSNTGKRKRAESSAGSGAKRARFAKNTAKPDKRPTKRMTDKMREQKQKGSGSERKKGKRWEKPTGKGDEKETKRPKKVLNEMEKIMKYKIKKKKMAAMKAKRKGKGRKPR